MPNKQPVAVLTVDKTELTLPDNEVQWSLADSYDINKNGQPTERNFTYSLKLNGTEVSKEESGSLALEVGEGHILTGTVTDKRGASSTDIAIINVWPPKPTFEPVNFGAKVVGLPIDEQIAVVKKANGTCIRLATELIDYEGEPIKALDRVVASGLKAILNINWEPAGSPRKFPTDMPKYESKLAMLLTKYGPHIEVGVCENEPTTDAFYDDNIQNYLTELKSFVKVCNQYNVKCTDGCIFVEWINTIIDGGRLRPNGEDNLTMVNAYKDIPLSYVNFHFVVKGTRIPDLKKASDYVRQLTGKQIMSNEHHYESSNTDTVKLVNQKVREAGFAYCLNWFGGNGSEAQPFNDGLELTPMGQAWAESVI